VIAMIQIITGQTGEGKTKQMIQLANEKSRTSKGELVYIDSSTHNRYTLSHRVRLIETSTFPLSSPNDFLGFLCGILSSNHDIELIFIDELLQITHLGMDDVLHFFDNLKNLSEKYQVDFVVGTSCANKDVPKHLVPYLIA
jgi:Cdc6-like AAA superfamily ATPase